MTELLNSIAYSPISKTSGVTLIDAVEITVADITKFPDVATGEVGVAVLCEDERFHSDDPTDYETVTYTGKDTNENKLTGVTREVEGTAKEWPDETVIACILTAEHIKRINEKVKSHQSQEVSDDEVHGIRVDSDSGSLEYNDGMDWIKISSIGNLDGGEPSTNYGGITSIDAGGVE